MTAKAAGVWHRFETFENGWEHFGSISRPTGFFEEDLACSSNESPAAGRSS